MKIVTAQTHTYTLAFVDALTGSQRACHEIEPVRHSWHNSSLQHFSRASNAFAHQDDDRTAKIPHQDNGVYDILVAKP